MLAARGTVVSTQNRIAVAMLLALCMVGCAPNNTLPTAPPATELPSADYVIGPGDVLRISVWQNPDLSVELPVRPDGRVSVPLIEDVVAVGKTPTALARELEGKLAKYVTKPVVTVMPREFYGPYAQQIRVIGEAVQPRALPYRSNMTVLDAIIAVGGLTKYAAGNRATLVRTANNAQETYGVRLDDLIRDGDIKENVALEPGDVLIIPQSYF
jgi:polysaccharide biosynthesis/export protein